MPHNGGQSNPGDRVPYTKAQRKDLAKRTDEYIKNRPPDSKATKDLAEKIKKGTAKPEDYRKAQASHKP
jgi:hypothetical protein